MMRQFLYRGTALGLLAAASACSSSASHPAALETPSTVTVCSVVSEPVAPSLAAPLPGATGVPPATRTLIFTGDVLPIQLVDTSTCAAVAASPTALPESLPSPIASPQFAGAGYYAVSIPALNAATSYDTQSQIPSYNCGMATTYRTANDGSFSTGSQ